MTAASIAQLPELIAALPDDLRVAVDRLLFVERVTGFAVLPPAMLPWVTAQFGDAEAVRQQTVIRVINRLTLEGALYNPLRDLRPLDEADHSTDGGHSLEAAIAAHTGRHDVFHNPVTTTTADTFGRIRGQYCVSASNVAKYDGWHGLVIFDEFHPLRFNQAQLRDYFDVALRWLAAAHRADSAARYPLITWNCLWKAGASITHGHLQMTLSQGMACGIVERWRRAAADYRVRYDRSYSTDLGNVYAALGLGFGSDERVRGYVTLTPVKDRELLLIEPDLARQGGHLDNDMFRTALTPLWDAIYTALRNLIDEQGVRSFNLAIYLPPCGTTAEPWDDLPICVRIVDRGHPTARAVNFGAMELFANSVVGADPFAVATMLRVDEASNAGI